MPIRPDEIAELSRLLDEALALEPSRREPWLKELAQTNPTAAQRLRGMLTQAEGSATGVLPKLDAVEADEAVARAGERVGPYVLVREIGRGGMGTVWLADRADGTYKRRVALKLPRLAWTAGLGKRMARERDIGALLEHPSIARLYDAGVDEHGRPFIAMEYIDGQPIDVYCRDHGLDLRAKLKLFIEVAQAVAYAHGRLVLHRDLKPANVLVDAGSHVHLLDFGIAKLLDEAGAGSELTQEQGRVLTLSYASPEQIAGRPLGVTADVYSLGVLLYELLTGTLPYTTQRRTAGGLEDAILAGDVTAPSHRVDEVRLARQLRGDLDAIVGKAIKRDPNERYQTAEALATDIRRYLDGHAIEARPDSAWYRLRKAVVRHKVPVVAVSAVVVVGLIGIATTAMQGRRAADEAERAHLATAFVSELFRVNSNDVMPMKAGAPRPTQAVLLERGAQLIEARFEKQPAMKAELYGVVGKIYADLGQDRLAIEFVTRQLRVLRERGALAPQISRSLMLLAQTALAAKRDGDAEDYAQQAVNALSIGDSLLPDALVLLARAQILNGKAPAAAQTAAQATAALQSSAHHKSSTRAWLLYVEGKLLSFQNRFTDALPVYQRAIAEALRAEGPTSEAAIEMQIALANDLIDLNRIDEARPFREAAIARLEGLGGLHLIRAARARALLQFNEFDTGFADFEETITVLNDVSGFLNLQSSALPAEVLAEIDFKRAQLYLTYGDYRQAEALVEASVPVLRASSQSLGVQFEAATLVGELKMCLGDHETADRFLRERMTIRGKMGKANSPFAAMDWLLVAINLSRQRRHQEAEALLSRAPTFGNVTGDTIADYARVIPDALARVRLDAGDIRGAQHAFSGPIELWENFPMGGEWRLGSYELDGEIKCALGEHRNGLAQLLKIEAIAAPRSSPGSPELARLRAVAGLCALSGGNRKQAEDFASQARRAFNMQPRVSAYFKEPLKRLEQQLGTKSI